jgi:N-acetylglucosaminyldiphosphoundecaprenol N-acetyl-beta-D-mannosaminyltransferase
VNVKASIDTGLLDRRVYGLLGIALTDTDQAEVLREVRQTVLARQRFLISTVNVNFLVISQGDREFRQSLCGSDLCTVDGVPITWLMRLLGVAFGARVAGSDLFQALLETPLLDRPLKIALFGGEEGVAQRAADRINGSNGAAQCVCAISPGFANVTDLSSDDFIAAINASHADFVSVSLGSLKGQLWLLRNDKRLTIPVRAHLGAVVNFLAGRIVRAPQLWRQWGAEWLWRIKEEPQLFNRYWKDGWILLYLVGTRVMPLAISLRWSKFWFRACSLKAEMHEADARIRLVVSGAATDDNWPAIKAVFEKALARDKHLVLDLTNVMTADPRFMGMLLMVRTMLERAGLSMQVEASSRLVKWQFRLNGFDFLLKGKD